MMDDQLTRCPHCNTSFLITDADLQRGCGVARCGSCLKIFSATSHLFTLEEIGDISFDPSIARPSSTEAELPSEITIESDANLAFATDPMRAEALVETLEEQKAAPQHDQQTTENIAQQAQPPEPAPFQQEKSTKLTETNSATNLPPVDKAPMMEALDMDLELDELREARSSRPLSERIDAEDSTPKGAAPQGFDQAYVKASPDSVNTGYNSNAEDAYDALADFDMTPVVAPEQHQATQKNSILLSKPAIATAALLCLLILAFLVLLGSTRSLSQNPNMNGFVETLCSISSCDHPLMADFKPLKTTQSSMSQLGDNNLLVDFVLENSSDNTLPFPAIIVELLNEEGISIEEQIFQPDLYLKGMPFADHQLPPELPVAITLSVTQASPLADDFRLTFVPPQN